MPKRGSIHRFRTTHAPKMIITGKRDSMSSPCKKLTSTPGMAASVKFQGLEGYDLTRLLVDLDISPIFQFILK
jgi:hypothetical protein